MSNEEDGSSGGADVVDFDALHAALGDLPPLPASAPAIGDSQGRLSATYASRPHPIPATRAPNDDPNTPAVIVQSDDTVPSRPLQKMTVRLGTVPISSGHHPVAGGHAQPVTPQPFAGQALPQATSDNVQLTMQMPERPRRPRSPTLMMRPRGPTKQQKLLVFMAMLLVFVGGGIAFLIYYKPPGLSLDVRPVMTTAVVTATTTPAATTATAVPVAPAATSASSIGTSTASATGTPASALPPAVVKKPPKRAPPQ